MSTLNLENIKHPDSASNNISVDSSGRVGIGTSSPATNLEVSGTISVSDSTTTTKRLQLDSGVSSHTINSANFGSDMMDLNVQAENLIFKTGLIGVVERMRIDSSGRVTMPNQPMFSGYRNTGNVASGNVVVHNIPTINRGSHYNSSNGRFTCPIDGAYFVSIGGHAENSNPSQTSVYLNGTLVFEEYQNGAAYGSTTATCIIYCNSGDYIEHRVTAGTYWGGNKSGLRMTVKLVG